jgi:hypothetical protein
MIINSTIWFWIYGHECMKLLICIAWAIVILSMISIWQPLYSNMSCQFSSSIKDFLCTTWSLFFLPLFFVQRCHVNNKQWWMDFCASYKLGRCQGWAKHNAPPKVLSRTQDDSGTFLCLTNALAVAASHDRKKKVTLSCGRCGNGETDYEPEAFFCFLCLWASFSPFCVVELFPVQIIISCVDFLHLIISHSPDYSTVNCVVYLLWCF